MGQGDKVITQLTDLIASLDRDHAATAVGLHELLHNGVSHIAGAQYAGITLAEKNRVVSSLAATHRYATALDEIQNQVGEGPCLEAAWQHQLMHIGDLNAERRWPRYRRSALEQTPIRCIMSYELAISGNSIAALNFYAERPHAFAADAQQLGEMFASHIALAWSIMRHHEQFRSALASRDVIGQAKGVIMERFRLDAVEAFELLARVSQQSNTRLIDVAQGLIDSEHPVKRRNQ